MDHGERCIGERRLRHGVGIGIGGGVVAAARVSLVPLDDGRPLPRRGVTDHVQVDQELDLHPGALGHLRVLAAADETLLLGGEGDETDGVVERDPMDQTPDLEERRRPGAVVVGARCVGARLRRRGVIVTIDDDVLVRIDSARNGHHDVSLCGALVGEGVVLDVRVTQGLKPSLDPLGRRVDRVGKRGPRVEGGEALVVGGQARHRHLGDQARDVRIVNQGLLTRRNRFQRPENAPELPVRHPGEPIRHLQFRRKLPAAGQEDHLAVGVDGLPGNGAAGRHRGVLPRGIERKGSAHARTGGHHLFHTGRRGHDERQGAAQRHGSERSGDEGGQGPRPGFIAQHQSEIRRSLGARHRGRQNQEERDGENQTKHVATRHDAKLHGGRPS